MPVREEIQFASTFRGRASSSFSTTRSGSQAATEAIPGPDVRFDPFMAPVARATRPSGSTSEASTSNCCSGPSSGKGGLPARQRLSLRPVDRAADEAGEDLAGADVDVARDPELVELRQHRRPADRAGEGGGEGISRVVAERL